MAYATAQRFVQEFGIAEASQLLIDTERLLTAELLAAAVAGALPAVGGAITQPMLDAAATSLSKLNRKLTNVSNFMDGYIRSVVTLPLAPGDANLGTLEDCCLALTRVGLAVDADNSTERMDKLDQQWRTWLRDVAVGKTQLVRSDTGTSPAVAHRVRSGQAKTGFDWDYHANFGRGGGAL